MKITPVRTNSDVGEIVRIGLVGQPGGRFHIISLIGLCASRIPVPICRVPSDG